LWDELPIFNVLAMKTLLLFFTLIYAGMASAQTTSVPDANFEQVLIGLGCDVGPPDGVVTTASIDTIIVLDVQSKSISDLTGIEDFDALITLKCNNNFLSTLNITQNFMLKTLYCYENTLTGLDITQNTSLIELQCYINSITSLNISNNPLLSFLACGNNPLGSLDVSQNTALNTLHCNNAQLSGLDVSQNGFLNTLECSNNDLINLDIAQNPSLKTINCFENSLTSLDVSQNTAITQLHCYGNEISSIDLTNNGNLIDLTCGNNQITELNLTQNPLLKTINTVNNQLVCLNLRTGHNDSIVSLLANDNVLLTCIEVDDDNYSTSNWTDPLYFLFDNWASFSTNCNNTCTVGVNEQTPPSKGLIGVIDLLGRESKIKPNTLLIYIYNDGSTKRGVNVNY